MPRTLSSVLACWLLSAAPALAAGDPASRSDGAELHSGPWTVRVTALSDDMVRVRAWASPAGPPEDASWAVPEAVRAHTLHVKATEDAQGVEFKTATLAVRIER